MAELTHAQQIRAERTVMDAFGMTRSQARSALRDFAKREREQRTVESLQNFQTRKPDLEIKTETQQTEKTGFSVRQEGEANNGGNTGLPAPLPPTVQIDGCLNGNPVTYTIYGFLNPSA